MEKEKLYLASDSEVNNRLDYLSYSIDHLKGIDDDNSIFEMKNVARSEGDDFFMLASKRAEEQREQD